MSLFIGKAIDPRASGERTKIRRNRKDSYAADAIRTDGQGNILDRPLLNGLLCFGDPIEWLMGRGDTKRQYGDKAPEPRGCAGCRVAPLCGNVADERLNAVREIRDAYVAWESDTYFLDQVERFGITSWRTLVEKVNLHKWADPNEERIHVARAEARKEQQARKRARTSAVKRKSNSPRCVSKIMRDAIQVYRDARVSEMLSQKNKPHSPLWIRNRDADRLILIADAWAVRELLERENMPSSGRAVLERLQREGKVVGDTSVSNRKRVEEALRRANRLEEERDWPFFDPLRETSPKVPGDRFHPNCVWEALELSVSAPNFGQGFGN